MNATTKIEAASLHSAMAAAFAKIEAATKAVAGQVGQQRYKYADIGAVIDAIKPALVEHGLFFTQRPQPSEGGVTVETVLHHAGGESISLGSLFVPADKNNAQAFGSALTYCRRYGLVTAFGVPTEDDDGNAAARRDGGHSHGDANGAVSPRQPKHSALRTAYRQFVHEANGCGDADELSAFLATADSVKLVAEVREKLPHIWDGENWPADSERPDEWEPLCDFINRRQRECAQATADYLTV